MLKGERVYLRPMERDDTEAVIRWRSDPETLGQLFSLLPHTREQHLQWYEDLQKRHDRLEFVIVETSSSQPIGTVRLSDIDLRSQKAEYGILIGETVQRGQGLAQEASHLLLDFAFDELNLHRVYLRVIADNQPAIALYERLGFRREGTLRDDVFKRGRFHDVLYMALLRDDWRQQSREEESGI
jgi:diamine N-acetyltransferase